MSVLGLAHVGDAVYELMARTYLAASGLETNRDFHKATVAIVSAASQASASERIAHMFTDEEAEVFQRGRNAHVHTIPHGASVGEYHAATALETLFGYLYLTGRIDRLNELFTAILEV